MLNIAWKYFVILFYSLLLTEGFALKKISILEGQSLAKNVYKIWNRFYWYQTHGRQKVLVLLEFKYDFGPLKNW